MRCAKCSLGISGLASYSTSKRIREIGTRRALGASRVRVIGMVVLEAAMTTVAGVLAGVALAIGMNYYGVRIGLVPAGLDAVHLAACGVFLLGLTAVAVYFPARRAGSIDPAVATKS